MTLDGYIAGPNGEMDWMTFNWSDDIKQYVEALTQPVDTILLGKNLAAGFIPHWNAVAQDENNPEKAAGVKFTETPKIVFSKTLTTSTWDRTEVENGDFVAKINHLKQQPGGDMITYGGGQFVSSLIRANLVDDLHLFVNPAIIGRGMPIFQEVTDIQRVRLAATLPFECGIIMLHYQPI
jgi:dihydrofolate reductase